MTFGEEIDLHDMQTRNCWAKFIAFQDMKYYHRHTEMVKERTNIFIKWFGNKETTQSDNQNGL